MDWSAPDAKTGVVFKDMSLVSEVQMEIRAGVLWVRWSFPPSVIDAIATQLSWTMIDIMEMSRLESYQAVALYEIVCRYKDNPSGVTSKQSTDWWTDALSPERTEPGGTRREWRKVKYEWVNKAIEEINSKTSLNIELLEERVGRTIKSAQFKVEKKRPEAEQARPQLVSKKIAQLAALNEVSVPSLVKMLGDGYDEEVFELAFMKLAKRVNMPNLDEVRNRQKYFESMVRQTAEQIRLDFGSEPDGEPIRAQFPNIEPTPPLQTPLQLAETVSDSRRREISEEFKLLNDEEQNRFGMAAARELEQLGLMTPQVKRRVGSGQWRNTQLVFFKAIDLFGKEKYGPDWLAAAHST